MGKWPAGRSDGRCAPTPPVRRHPHARQHREQGGRGLHPRQQPDWLPPAPGGPLTAMLALSPNSPVNPHPRGAEETRSGLRSGQRTRRDEAIMNPNSSPTYLVAACVVISPPGRTANTQPLGAALVTLAAMPANLSAYRRTRRCRRLSASAAGGGDRVLFSCQLVGSDLPVAGRSGAALAWIAQPAAALPQRQRAMRR